MSIILKGRMNLRKANYTIESIPSEQQIRKRIQFQELADPKKRGPSPCVPTRSQVKV